MDEIQRILVKAGREDLAQEYYKKVAGDEQEEGRIALRTLVSDMHSLGIYEILSDLGDNTLSKIKKYDPETAQKLSKAKSLVTKEIIPLVVDLNTWFKEQ